MPIFMVIIMSLEAEVKRLRAENRVLKKRIKELHEDIKQLIDEH